MSVNENATMDDEDSQGEYGASYVGSFGKEFYSDNEQDNNIFFPNEQKPKILLMGLRRSGKSSIQQVVFHKLQPTETVYLESTNKINTDDVSSFSFIQFKILDFPGQIDFFENTFDPDNIFSGQGTLIFVIDAQVEYADALDKLHETILRAYKINDKLKFEVFIHKVDSISDDQKIETQRDINQRVNDELKDESGLSDVVVSFHLTSIYDHSIFEAFSKVVQKVIPQLPMLETLLNNFNSNSGIDKSFLFDIWSKIYIATDSQPVDNQSYELCCDMIDVVLDISNIYGQKESKYEHDQTASFDNDSSCEIRLDNHTILYVRQVTQFLALVCILNESNYKNPGLIYYNYLCFQKAVLEVFEIGANRDNNEIVAQSSPPHLNNISASNSTPVV